jgi:hypothetical protein
MLEELRTMLPMLQPRSARDDARRVIMHENVLRRASVTSRRQIFEKLSGRYFRPDAPLAVARFVHAMQTIQDPLQSGLLAYTMLVWNDALVSLLGCKWLAPKLAGPLDDAGASDIEAELDRLSTAIPQIRKWAPPTRGHVATHSLSVLRDCGYATGTVRKRLRQPFISPDVVLFGAQLILGSGEPASRFPAYTLFMAMGISIAEVIDALTDLHQRLVVNFAIQGDTVRFTVRGETPSRST